MFKSLDRLQIMRNKITISETPCESAINSLKFSNFNNLMIFKFEPQNIYNS